jgi:hypothetical protein
MTVSRVIHDSTLQGKPVLISGTISDVCQNKGCWLVVTDGDQKMRVTFKDYAFFVPKDAGGRKVLLEGIVKQKTISEGTARHYASEGKEEKKVGEIHGPQNEVTMEASAVTIEKAS